MNRVASSYPAWGTELVLVIRHFKRQTKSQAQPEGDSVGECEGSRAASQGFPTARRWPGLPDRRGLQKRDIPFPRVSPASTFSLLLKAPLNVFGPRPS
jgi:hypothetical protein